jgi:uncharacterized protein (DUF305 family)
MKQVTMAALAALLALAVTAAMRPSAPSFAQEKGSGSGSGSGAMMKKKMGKGSGSGSAAAIKGDTGPSSQAYNDANMKMHKDMNITFSGDADVDFAKGMIAHHQGAIDTAKIVLQYGKDAELKKLAEDIIKAQETEIAFMTEWLKKKGK